MKSAKKTKTKSKKVTSDELRKPTKMVPTKEKEKNNWKNSSSEEFDDLDDQVMDENFKDFEELSSDSEDDEDDY